MNFAYNWVGYPLKNQNSLLYVRCFVTMVTQHRQSANAHLLSHCITMLPKHATYSKLFWLWIVFIRRAFWDHYRSKSCTSEGGLLTQFGVSREASAGTPEQGLCVRTSSWALLVWQPSFECAEVLWSKHQEVQLRGCYNCLCGMLWRHELVFRNVLIRIMTNLSYLANGYHSYTADVIDVLV